MHDARERACRSLGVEPLFIEVTAPGELARALGITVPQALLLRADRVKE